MGLLTSETLFDDHLPVEYAPLLDQLAQLDALVRNRNTPDRTEQAQRIHAEMVRLAGELHDATPPALVATDPRFQRWFTEAVLLWPEFANAGGTIRLDTMGVTRLCDYVPDLPDDIEARGKLRQALLAMFGWKREQLVAIESGLREQIANLKVKHAITRALAFELTNRPDRGAAAKELMIDLYGELPWLDDDVKVVVTSSAIFMAIPMAASELEGARTDRERALFDAFFAHVQSEQRMLKNIRFPAFGLFERERVSLDLIRRLTAAVQHEPHLEHVTEAIVVQTLWTMVTLVPLHEADLYLVHDVWGHGWQESLGEFEWTFQQLDHLDDSPLTDDDLKQLFTVVGGRTTLDVEGARKQMHTELRGRIRIGLNVAVSELLADIVEHKFARLGTPLPTSSLIDRAPLRLDLTINDVRTMIERWRAPFVNATEHRSLMVERLAALGLPSAGAANAVDDWVILVRELDTVLSSEIVFVRDAQGVRTNLFGRLLIDFATIESAVSAQLDAGDAKFEQLYAPKNLPRWRCPQACIDLLVLMVGWIYEQERDVHLWHLDELLRQSIAPTLDKLEAALNS